MEHYMFRPNWSSSNVQGVVLKEPAAVLLCCSAFILMKNASKIFYCKSFLKYQAIITLFLCTYLVYLQCIMFNINIIFMR
jgi:hypothetical protein